MENAQVLVLMFVVFVTDQVSNGLHLEMKKDKYVIVMEINLIV